jgi:hypothetical protein
MRYVVSCQWCEFIAEASDLRSLGLQLNPEASNCAHDPLLLIEKEEGEVTADPSGGRVCDKVA